VNAVGEKDHSESWWHRRWEQSQDDW